MIGLKKLERIAIKSIQVLPIKVFMDGWFGTILVLQ